MAAAGGEETRERGAARGEEGATALRKKETRRGECAAAVRGQDGELALLLRLLLGKTMFGSHDPLLCVTQIVE